MDQIKTGALIRAQRLRQGMTQLQLAEQIGVSDKTVSKWERGCGAPDIELLPALSNIKPYVAENKLYIRLASNDMFSISQNVVQRILLGELTTPKSAFDAFNELLSAPKAEEPVAAHINTSYSNCLLYTSPSPRD